MRQLIGFGATAAMALGLVACGSDSNDNGNGNVIAPPSKLFLNEIGRYDNAGDAEIVAFDPVSQRVFVITGGSQVEVLDLSDPSSPTLIDSIEIGDLGGGVNSVAVLERAGDDSVVALAIERSQDVTFFKSGHGSGAAKVPTGADSYAADEVYLLTDRGPNATYVYTDAAGDPVSAKIFPMPDFTPNIGRFGIDAVSGELVLLEEIQLKNQADELISGLPNPGATSTGELALDLDLEPLGTDVDGLDSEGLVALWNGGSPQFWVSDEYGPWLRQYDADGTELQRISPHPIGDNGTDRQMPRVYAKRRANRGMEGLTYVPASDLGVESVLDSGTDWLVGVMQSTMQNPVRRQSFDHATNGAQSLDVRKSALTRLLFLPVDDAFEPIELIYVQEQAGYSNSEIRYVPGSNGLQFVVLERDGALSTQDGSTGFKRLYAIDISGATDVNDALDAGTGLAIDFDIDGDGDLDSVTIEQLGIVDGSKTANQSAGDVAATLTSLAITPVTKTLYLDMKTTDDGSGQLAYLHDKPEGFVLLDHAERVVWVINDDDFGLRVPEVDLAGGGSLEPGQILTKLLADGNPDIPTLYEMDADADGIIGTAFTAHPYPQAEMAIAVASDDSRQLRGAVAFFNASTLELINLVPVGYLPDMLTFSPDGQLLVVANEGEPNDQYTFDPPGSVSVIDVSSGVAGIGLDKLTEIGFESLDGQEATLRTAGVRIFGPGASSSQDLEPEYVAISPDGSTAWVVLQENNAVAIIDLGSPPSLSDVVALGTKDFSLSGNEIDASNKEGILHNLQNWPVQSYYLPDAMASFSVGGATFYITANEGDARDYAGFSEEARVKDLVLDPAVFTTAGLQDDDQLGRLKITTTAGHGEADGDVEYETLYGYGGRSFSVWNSTGSLVHDSGTEIADRTNVETIFNAEWDDTEWAPDERSDDKGAEPEGVTVGVIGGRPIAFIGLERAGGILAYDLSVPGNPQFLDFAHPILDDPAIGGVAALGAGRPAPHDMGPQGLKFVPAAKSPNGKDLLIVGNEVSGSTTIYEISETEVVPVLVAPKITN
jgi:hypothetical protein